MSDVCHGMQVHCGMVSDPDERIAAQPLHEVDQWIVGRELFPYGMDPGALFPSQYRCNLATGEQPDLVSVHILNRRSEEHTSELQSRQYLVCRLLLEKKKLTMLRQPEILNSLDETNIHRVP